MNGGLFKFNFFLGVGMGEGGLKISDVSALPDYFTGIALKSYNFLHMIFD